MEDLFVFVLIFECVAEFKALRWKSVRWHNFTNTFHSSSLATQWCKIGLFPSARRILFVCLHTASFFFRTTPLPPPISFWFCCEDPLVFQQGEPSPFSFRSLPKETSHAFDQNMGCMHNQGGPCMATAVVALATSLSLRKGHVWSFGAKVLTGAVKTDIASWHVDPAIMNIQTQNSVIHLLVYHPNKGLGLCAYGYSGVLHHYVKWLVVFLDTNKLCRLAAAGVAYYNLLPGARKGGQRSWKMRPLVMTSFLFPPERKGKDRRRQNPLQLQIAITLQTQ